MLIRYQWHGHDRDGRDQAGTISAPNTSLARLQLHQQGIQVTGLRPATTLSPSRRRLGPWSITRRQAVRPRDTLVFYQQTGRLLKAGIPMLQALEIVTSTLPAGRLLDVVHDIKSLVSQGTPLGEAMDTTSSIFDPLTISLIRSGERAGTLDIMMQRITDHHERRASLRRRIRSAMIYPAAVLITALLVCTLLLTHLVPQFSATFSQFNTELPALTRVVIHLSDLSQQYSLPLAAACVLSGMLGQQLLRRSHRLQIAADHVLLKVPVLGDIIRHACLARLTRTLATILSAGLPLIDALRSAAEISGNHVYRQAILTMAEQVNTGHRLDNVIRLSGVFPVMMAQLIHAGEESGNLESMLVKCAEFCEQHVEQSVDTLTRLLEPAIMLILGLLTGTLMLAMYLPVFQLGSVI